MPRKKGKMSEAQKKHLRTVMEKKWKDRNYRENVKAGLAKTRAKKIKSSKSPRESLSARMKKKWKDPEYRNRVLEARFGKPEREVVGRLIITIELERPKEKK